MRVKPSAVLSYETVTEETVKFMLNNFSTENMKSAVIWLDEIQHWTSFNFDAIQIEDQTLNLFGYSFPLGNIIFSGYSLKANESTMARLNFQSLPRPTRKEIFKALSVDERFQDLKRLKKVIDFTSCNFHEVVNLYNSESKKTVNPLGLSDYAFTLLLQIAEGKKVVQLMQKNGWKRSLYLDIEAELEKEKLIERDAKRDSIRVLTALGRKKSKEKACKI